MPDPPNTPLLDTFDYEKFYKKYKDATDMHGQILFAFLYVEKKSPYYDEKKGMQMFADLNDPVGYFHLFICHMIENRYDAAFECYKLYEPFLYQAPYDSLTELKLWYFHHGSGFVNRFKREIEYFCKISYDYWKRKCDTCRYGSICIHLKLNDHDIVELKRIRSGKIL